VALKDTSYLGKSGGKNLESTRDNGLGGEGRVVAMGTICV